MSRPSVSLAVALGFLAAAPALADDWQMVITVDNQYDIYFGTPLTTTHHAGGDNNWSSTETWYAYGRAPTDYLYVATASDYTVAQGFIGEFTNLTLGTSIETGDQVWEVFPAGKYLQQIDPTWPSPWPISLMPTQSQVDQAISFATLNNLWVAPTKKPGYDNASSPFPWGIRPGIPGSAFWIWYDSGNDPMVNPYIPAPYNGFNHDEFLVFRVPGIVPEPTTALMAAGLGGLALVRRRRTA